MSERGFPVRVVFASLEEIVVIAACIVSHAMNMRSHFRLDSFVEIQ